MTTDGARAPLTQAGSGRSIGSRLGQIAKTGRPRWAGRVQPADLDSKRARTHEATWEAQLTRLAAYKAEHGDCGVPRNWPEDPRLSRWVHTQRIHKRKLDRGESSHGMTAKRAARLTAHGLAWDPCSGGKSQVEAEWEVQLSRLAAYKAAHGDCNVPWSWAEGERNIVATKLGRWVSKQREGKRKLDRGEPGEGMTAERAARLTALGFAWNPGHDPGHDPSSAPRRASSSSSPLAPAPTCRAVRIVGIALI